MAADELTEAEAEYAYKPTATATVRTFGQLIGHVAGTQNHICAAVLGDQQPAEDAIEKRATTKAALVAALKASNAYCAKAYAIAASASIAKVNMFGEKSSKIGALALYAVHDGEHHGNMSRTCGCRGRSRRAASRPGSSLPIAAVTFHQKGRDSSCVAYVTLVATPCPDVQLRGALVADFRERFRAVHGAHRLVHH